MIVLIFLVVVVVVVVGSDYYQGCVMVGARTGL